MQVAALEKKLESEKKKYLASKANIKKLRLKIAKMKCPYKIGDSIWIEEDSEVWEIKVKFIDFALRQREFSGPKANSETTWMVKGSQKYKKGPKSGLHVFTTGFSKVFEGVHINPKISDKTWMSYMAIEREFRMCHAGF